ncbi:MAG: hypothetical protein ACSLFQ_21490 [Thermoanaerobaculia bacterium]
MRVDEGSLAALVARALDRLEIEFMLVGAAALAARGLTRGTRDLDFMTTDRTVLGLDWSALLPPDARIDVKRGDSDDPLAGVVRFVRSDAEEVDLVVARWKWQQSVLERSEACDVGAFVVRVPSVGDLVLLKLEAGSFLDQRDAAQLLEIHGAAASRDIDERIAELPEQLQRAWQSFRRGLTSS